MWNMKVLSFADHKLWPRLKFLSTDDDNNDEDNAGAMTIVLRTSSRRTKQELSEDNKVRRKATKFK